MSKSLEELQREYDWKTENPIWTAVPANSAAIG